MEYYQKAERSKSYLDVDRSVRMAIAGLKMGSYSDANGNKKEIMIEYPPIHQRDIKHTLIP